MSRNRACSLLALIATAGALAPIAGQAGDFADRALLGFSPDGRYFAFEEYGIQDGSGFPYSNIFLIDTTTDEWVTGTPIRVLTEGESPPLSETRSESADRFHPYLVERQIGAEQAPVGDPVARLEVRRRGDLHAVDPVAKSGQHLVDDVEHRIGQRFAPGAPTIVIADRRVDGGSNDPRHRLYPGNGDVPTIGALRLLGEGRYDELHERPLRKSAGRLVVEGAFDVGNGGADLHAPAEQLGGAHIALGLRQLTEHEGDQRDAGAGADAARREHLLGIEHGRFDELQQGAARIGR